MPTTVLARAIARAIPTTGLSLVELPASTTDAFMEALVATANDDTAGDVTRAIWVVGGQSKPVLPRVHFDEAEKYRVGNRAFVFRYGDYAPRSSMTSSASPWLSATFPARSESGLTLQGLANAIVAELGAAEELAQGGELAASVRSTLEVLRDIIEHAGDGERPWAEVWWEAAARFADRLVIAVPALVDQGIPLGTAVAASASLPGGVLATGTKKAAISPRDIEVLIDRLSRPDDRELVNARLEGAGETGGLLELDTHQVGRSLAEGKHPVIGLMDAWRTGENSSSEIRKVVETARTWAAVSAEQVDLSIKDPDGTVALAVEGGGVALYRLKSGAYVLPSLTLPWTLSDRWEADLALEVRVTLGQQLVAAAGTTLMQVRPVRIGSCSPVEWEAKNATVTFRASIALRVKTAASWPEKPAALSIKVPPPLVGALGSTLQLQLVIGAPFGPTMLITDARDRVVVSHSPMPAREGEADFPDEWTVRLKSGLSRATLTVLVPQDGSAADNCELNHQEVRVEAENVRVAPDVDLVDGAEIRYTVTSTGAKFGLKLSVEPASASAEWLPIAAAFKGELPNNQPSVPDALAKDIRGELEDHLRVQLGYWKGGATLPLHAWVLRSGDPERHNIPLPDTSGVAWLGPFTGNIDLSPASLVELQASNEYASFCAAFHALIGAVEAMEEGVTKSLWVSRWSLRRVSGDVVDGYLNAWADLLKVATGKQRAWAAFPFSAVLCEQNLKIVGALLSPLHPLRLAWAWGVERSFASLRPGTLPRLQQLVEGWNFPAVIGDLTRGASRIHQVAVPLWPGQSRAFIAWSAVADVSSATARLPETASGRRIPAGGSSGLTGGAVTGAVRDYLRVYPHASALTVELHAAAEVARSVELDFAVIQELAEYSAGATGLHRLRYMQVLDSTNRLNDAPESQDLLSTVYKRAGSIQKPFRWTRLRPKLSTRPAVDIRFVEDAHASITISSDDVAYGTAGSVPLRRALPRDRTTEGGLGLHIASGGGAWPAFERGLRSVEVSNGKPAVLVVEQTADAIGTDNLDARWVVTGSALTDPSALSSALASGQLLWEWRPAAAARGDEDASLAGRPYVTVARVPGALVTALQALSGVEDATRATALLAELGRRGVGLAALVGIGGHHADGALGFFLGFRLLDAALSFGDPTGISLIVPIDAVHPLLEAVAQRGETELGNRRADLLVMRLEAPADGQPRLTLMPIEIRCSNMRKATAPMPFPSMQNGEVKSKVEQVEATSLLLRAVQQRFFGDENLGTFAATALAALVEAGIAMVPDPVPLQVQSKVIQSLATRKAEVKVAPGILLWFQKDDSTDGFNAETQGAHAAVMVNPVSNNRDFWASIPSSLLTDFSATLRQQFDAATPAGPGSQDPRTESDGHTTADHSQLASDHAQVSETDARSSEHARSDPARPEEPLPSGPPAQQTEPTPAVAGSKELPELTTNADMSVPRDPATGVASRPQAYLGSQRSGGDVLWDPLNPEKPLNNAHIVIVGAAGSGKTQAIKAIMGDVTKAGIPALVLDFKDDYIDAPTRTACGAKLWNVRDGLPFNPLALPSAESRVVDVIYGLKGILGAVYGLGDQQSASLKDALEQCYGALGFKLQDAGKVDESRDAPTLDNLKNALAQMPNTGTLRNRLGALFDFELFQPDAAGMQELLRGPGIVRFTQLPQEELKSATAALLLRALYLHFQRIGHSGGKLRLLLVIDEAHRVANLDEVRLLVKEARAYGIGVVLSTQEATDLNDFAYSNAGTLISLKLAAAQQAERVARMLARTQAEASGVADTLRALPMFDALVRNDQYTPYRRISMLPFFRRTYEPPAFGA